MFNRLDLYLLDKVFNPLSTKLFKQFGVSNFTIAKIALMIGTAGLLLIAFGLLSGKLSVPDPLWLSMLCLMEFYFAYYGVRASILQEAKWKNPKPGQLPENFRDAPRKEVENRRFFLWVTIIIGTFSTVSGLSKHGYIVDFYRALTFIPILVGFYFLACTPPGPRDQMERESRRKVAFATD